MCVAYPFILRYFCKAAVCTDDPTIREKDEIKMQETRQMMKISKRIITGLPPRDHYRYTRTYSTKTGNNTASRGDGCINLIIIR